MAFKLYLALQIQYLSDTLQLTLLQQQIRQNNAFLNFLEIVRTN